MQMQVAGVDLRGAPENYSSWIVDAKELEDLGELFCLLGSVGLSFWGERRTSAVGCDSGSVASLGLEGITNVGVRFRHEAEDATCSRLFAKGCLRLS